MVARGIMLGADEPVILHLLDIEPAKKALEGVKMELLDAAFPLLQGAAWLTVLEWVCRAHTGPLPLGVIATTDVQEACKDVDIAVMVGGFPRKAGMERKDVMSKNVSIYASQASALEKYASKDVKVSHQQLTVNVVRQRETRPSPCQCCSSPCAAELDSSATMLRTAGRGGRQPCKHQLPHSEGACIFHPL
jgi:hypothetical protein